MALLISGHSNAKSRRIRALALLVAAAMSVLLLSGTAHAQKRAQIDELKAAFVFQLCNFVKWPDGTFDDPAAPLVVGVMGNEGMAEMLRQSVLGKSVDGHPIVVRELTEPRQAKECGVVFLDSGNDKRVDDYLDVVRTLPILTVSDDSDFTEKGGIVKLFEQQNKLRIEINVDEAERSKLTISSKLLSLAKLVRDDV